MNTTTRFKSFVTGVAVNLAATAAYGTAHLMQIEQVIGGVNGDTSAQAIQLRMRADNQHLTVVGTRIVAYDAAGQNPVLIFDILLDPPLANGLLGDRILLATANFSNFTDPGITPDYVASNPIPASYLAAGSLTYETDGGTVYWRLSWGGSAYTGPTGGDHGNFTDNDDDDEFGLPFPGSLPSDGLTTLLFQGSASALSTNNADDYALSEGPAVITNNSRDSGTVTAPAPFGACCENQPGTCTEGIAEAECQGPPTPSTP